jgi:hypothetical protein
MFVLRYEKRLLLRWENVRYNWGEMSTTNNLKHLSYVMRNVCFERWEICAKISRKCVLKMTGNVCYGWWEILASNDFKCVIQVMKNVCYTWREKCSISNEKCVLHPTRKKCYKWWGMFATGDLKCVLHVIVMWWNECAPSDRKWVPQVKGKILILPRFSVFYI